MNDDPLAAAQDASDMIADATLATYNRLKPMFDRPLRAREYNVAIQLLEQTIAELSEGQVQPTFTRATGPVGEVDAKVWGALLALEQYDAFDTEFSAQQAASKGEAFANLASVLASKRRTNANRTERPGDAEQRAAAATGPEAAAADVKRDAAGIAQQLRQLADEPGPAPARRAAGRAGG